VGNTTMVKANPNKNQNTCTFTIKEKTKKIIVCVPSGFELTFSPFAPFREMIYNF
jgi:hypothetical protein